MPQYQGIWNLAQQAQALVSQQWVTDPLFDYTTLLLQGDNVSGSSQNNVFVDSSTNNLLITRNGNTTQGSFSPFSLQPGEWSNYFNGSSYITAAANAVFSLPGDFTVECWINCPSLSTGNSLWIMDVGGSSYFALNVGQTATDVYLNSLGVVFTATHPAIPYNTWVHIALVRSGSTVRVYINGVQATGTGTNSSTLGSSTATFRIGGFTGAVTGYISNLRVTKGGALYTSNFTPSAIPLTTTVSAGTVSLLTCQANRFFDSSSNGLVITVAGGAPSVQAFSPFAPQLQYTAAGITAWSASFGTANYLESTFNQAFTGTTNFCFETWMYPTATPTQEQFWFSSTQSGVFCDSWVNTSLNIEVRISASVGTTLTSTSTVTVNTWNHVAVTFDGTTLRIFINGVASGSTSFTMFTGTTTRYSVAYNDYAPDPRYFTGYLSSWRVSVGTPRYTTAFTPLRTPLVSDAFTIVLLLQSSTFIDTSGNNRTIVSYGTPTIQSFSPFNQGVTGGSGYFDGTTDYLNGTITAVNNTTMTMECWLYQTSLNNVDGNHYVQVDNGANTNYALAHNGNGAARFLSRNNTGGAIFDLASANGVLKINQWQHIVGVRNASAASLYVDGVRVATISSPSVSSTDGTSLFIGTNAAGASPRYMNGYMASARIVSGTAVYDPTLSTLPVPTAPLSTITNTRLLLNFTNAGILDGTMKNNLETVGNAQIRASTSKYGSGSMFFDGTDDRVSIPTNPNLDFGSGDFTIECWACNTAWDVTQNQLFERGQFTVAKAYRGWMTATAIVFEINLSATATGTYTTVTATITNNLNQWYHVAFVRLNNVFTIYRDGIALTSTTNTATAFTTTEALSVGGAADANNNIMMNGYIDDFRITKGIARYNRNFTPPQVALPRQ